ncbi:hypothetical protein MAR_021860 [Mya arenaria]|uniref:Uncharacterized protein n=1 Tax=Mya arenaria TaxID=6604 RepID=A0ABY7EH54_MYAAR|nr:hypothetical protein MAR_021860 [Mya arenaria]
MDNICVVVLILLYNIKDVGATCGHLTYQEPAIQGRNVTFVFRPNTFKKNNNVTVRYDKTSIIYRNFPFDINDEVYYIHLDTTVDDLNNSYIFVKYGNCFTDWRKLTLMITREDSSTLSEEVNGTDVVKPRTVMSNTEGAVTKSKEKTTGALIYADLDIELLEAARKARKEQPQSAPTEYADIRYRL